MKLKEFLARKKPHKYRAKPVTIDGRRFASTLEGKRYSQLKMLEKAGKISDLECQKRFPLSVNGVQLAVYVADFFYHRGGWTNVIEDVKGVRTPLYKLKKKLFETISGLKVTELTRKEIE